MLNIRLNEDNFNVTILCDEKRHGLCLELN